MALSFISRPMKWIRGRNEERPFGPVRVNDLRVPLSGDSNSTSNANVFVSDSTGLSTYFGVFQPCILSIFGAILFLRLSWAVGEVGWLITTALFLLGAGCVTLTTLSIAAISTNGVMKGGGAYYMSSRSLGPELGGAVGIIFFLANSISIAFYLISFAEGIYPNLNSLNEANTGVAKPWMLCFIATTALFVIIVIAFAGSRFVVKLYTFIFATLMLGIFTIFFSLVFEVSNATSTEGYHGLSFELLSQNAILSPSNGSWDGYCRVFLVIFPACTGIMAGANFSGDLKNPGESILSYFLQYIGPGTLMAILFSMTIYILLAFVFGSSFDVSALRSEQATMFTQTCSFSPKLVLLGLCCSTISSALGALCGASKTLQALANDKLLSKLNFFGGNGVPIRATLLSSCIAQCGLLHGNLDVVAKLITEAFLIVYVLLNASCFLMAATGSPNFRPRFKYFSKWTALGGAILSSIIMFIGSAVTASLSILGIVALATSIHMYAPEVSWGNVTQALIFHQARKFLLQLQESDDPKFWRPSILLLVGDHELQSPRLLLSLLDLANAMKKGGLCIVGNILLSRSEKLNILSRKCLKMKAMWRKLVHTTGIKAFSEVVFSKSAREGAQMLMITSGIGGLRPNSVCFPLSWFNKENGNNDTSTGTEASDTDNSLYVNDQRSQIRQFENLSLPIASNNDTNWGHKVIFDMSQSLNNLRSCGSTGSPKSANEFIGIMCDALSLRMNLLVTNNCDLYSDISFESEQTGKLQFDIDVWLISSGCTDGGFSPSLSRKNCKEMKADGFNMYSNMDNMDSTEHSIFEMETTDSTDTISIHDDSNTYYNTNEDDIKNIFGNTVSSDGSRINHYNRLSSSGTLSLQLQLAHILERTTEDCRVRFLAIVPRPTDIESVESEMKKSLKILRMDAIVQAFPLIPCYNENADAANRASQLLESSARLGGGGCLANVDVILDKISLQAINAKIKQNSQKSRFAIFALPLNKLHASINKTHNIETKDVDSSRINLSDSVEDSEKESREFLERMAILTHSLCPSILCCTSKRREQLVSTDI